MSSNNKINSKITTDQSIPGQTFTNNEQTNNDKTIPGQTDSNIRNPLIGEQLPVVEHAASKFNMPLMEKITMEQQLAVNPALFAANYIPLPDKVAPEQRADMQGKT